MPLCHYIGFALQGNYRHPLPLFHSRLSLTLSVYRSQFLFSLNALSSVAKCEAHQSRHCFCQVSCNQVVYDEQRLRNWGQPICSCGLVVSCCRVSFFFFFFVILLFGLPQSRQALPGGAHNLERQLETGNSKLSQPLTRRLKDSQR